MAKFIPPQPVKGQSKAKKDEAREIALKRWLAKSNRTMADLHHKKGG